MTDTMTPTAEQTSDEVLARTPGFIDWYRGLGGHSASLADRLANGGAIDEGERDVLAGRVAQYRRLQPIETVPAPIPASDATPDVTLDALREALGTDEALALPDAKLAKLRKLVEDRNSARATVERLNRELTSATLDEITDPYDSRVVHWFVDAAEYANEQGYCEVYDRIAAHVGIPTRDDLEDRGLLPEHTYEVTMLVTTRQTFTYEGRDRQSVRDRVNDFDTDEIESYTGIDEITRWEIDEITEV